MKFIFRTLFLTFILITNAEKVSFAASPSLIEETPKIIRAQQLAASLSKSAKIPIFISGLSSGLFIATVSLILHITPDDYYDLLRDSNEEEHNFAVKLAVTGLLSAAVSIGSGILAYKNGKSSSVASSKGNTKISFAKQLVKIKN